MVRPGSSSGGSMKCTTVCLLCVTIARGITAAVGGAAGGTVTLRVRMPSGQVQRLEAQPTDSLFDIEGKLGLKDGEVLSTSVAGSGGAAAAAAAAAEDTSNTDAERGQCVGELGLKQGDFLYACKGQVAAAAAAEAKAKALERVRAASTSDADARDQWERSPFPALARPLPPRQSTAGTRTQLALKDIEALAQRTFQIVPQKTALGTKISVEEGAFDELVGFVQRQCQLGAASIKKKTKNKKKKPTPTAAATAATAAASSSKGVAKARAKGAASNKSGKAVGAPPPSATPRAGKQVCALLFGTVSDKDKSIRVEAVLEVPQSAASPTMYDPEALVRGMVKVSSSSPDTNSKGGRKGEAPDVVARACKVASLLGLQPVGWCLSHPARDYFMSAADVAVAARLEAAVIATHGPNLGALQATVTLPMNYTTGQVATEAYAVSNLTVQMTHEGVVRWPQPKPEGKVLNFTEAVKEEWREVEGVETVLLVNPVPIVKHKGFLSTNFPALDRPGPGVAVDPTQALAECLFSPSGKRAAASSSAPSTSNAELLKRAADFRLLVYLSRELGFGPDLTALCAAVRNKDVKSPALSGLKLTLRAMTHM